MFPIKGDIMKNILEKTTLQREKLPVINIERNKLRNNKEND